MNIQKLIALADLAKSGAFNESEIARMVQAMMGEIPASPPINLHSTAASFPEPLVPLQLGYAERFTAAVAAVHPTYPHPTWVCDGKVMVSFWGFLDAIKYKSAAGSEKLLKELRSMGALNETTAHVAPSDDGDIYLAKTNDRYETRYAALDDLTAAAQKIFRGSTFARLTALGAVAAAPGKRAALRAVA